MGLAFLPWERLPAYVLGPLSCLFGFALLFADKHKTLWHIGMAIAFICFGLWLVWYRYTWGIEPLWTEEQRNAKKRKDALRSK